MEVDVTAPARLKLGEAGLGNQLCKLRVKQGPPGWGTPLPRAFGQEEKGTDGPYPGSGAGMEAELLWVHPAARAERGELGTSPRCSLCPPWAQQAVGRGLTPEGLQLQLQDVFHRAERWGSRRKRPAGREQKGSICSHPSRAESGSIAECEFLRGEKKKKKKNRDRKSL